MAMNFEELDDVTRRYMLAEFELEEQSPSPYRGKGLTNGGKAVFPDLMRNAVKEGNEHTLAQALLNSAYWHRTETYVRAGVERERQVNILQTSERLALSEFNTWYVRGLAKRLMDENVTRCQAYRAQVPKWEPGDCASHEGEIFAVEIIYHGHRARYWPEPGNRNAMSIPFGPGCHHSIRRVR
jgi:hypothetical protein